MLTSTTSSRSELSSSFTLAATILPPPLRGLMGDPLAGAAASPLASADTASGIVGVEGRWEEGGGCFNERCFSLAMDEWSLEMLHLLANTHFTDGNDPRLFRPLPGDCCCCFPAHNVLRSSSWLSHQLFHRITANVWPVTELLLHYHKYQQKLQLHKYL